MSQHGGACRRAYQFAVLLEHTSHQRQVEAPEGYGVPDQERAGAAVVGYHVGQRERVAREAGVENVSAGATASVAARTSWSPTGPSRSPRGDEGVLRLGTGLDETAAVEGLSGVQTVPVGEPSVQRFRHPHLLLLGPAGQAELGRHDGSHHRPRPGPAPRPGCRRRRLTVNSRSLVRELMAVRASTAFASLDASPSTRSSGDDIAPMVPTSHPTAGCAAAARRCSSIATSIIMSSWPPTTLRSPNSSRMSFVGTPVPLGGPLGMEEERPVDAGVAQQRDRHRR